MISKEYTKSTYAIKPIAEHIYYWLRQKSGKRFDSQRANFTGNVSDLWYFNDLIELQGKNLSAIELENECNKYAVNLLKSWNTKYAGSKKMNSLDSNGECHSFSNRTISKSSNNGGIKAKKSEPVPELPVRFGSHRLDDTETQRIRDLAFKNFHNLTFEQKAERRVFNQEDYARWMIKDFLVLWAKDFEKEFHNACKAEQTNPTKKHCVKTKISDIELTTDVHIDEDWAKGAHIHYIAPPFDPATGLFANPRNYVKIYRAIGDKLEKKYSFKNKSNRLYKFLDEGTALGNIAKLSNDLKSESLTKIQNNTDLLDIDLIKRSFVQHNNLDGSIEKSFDDIVKDESNRVYEEHLSKVSSILVKSLSSHNLDYDSLSNFLEKHGVSMEFIYEHESNDGEHYKKKTTKEQIFVFKDKSTGLEFTNANFKGDARKKLKQFAGSESDRNAVQSQIKSSIAEEEERKPFDLENVEKVLAHNMNMIKKKMAHEFSLSTLSSDDIKIRKGEYFEDFMSLCMADGILVNLNKQGNLTYHKVIKNKTDKSDYKAIKYKSSWFSDDLHGKTMKELFELDTDTIIRLNLTWIMDLFPQKFMQYNVAYMRSDHNLAEKMERSSDSKSYLLVSIQRNYDWRQLEQHYLSNGGFYIYSGQRGEPSAFFKPAREDGVFDIEFKPFDARKAAADVWAYVQKDVIDNPNNVSHFYAEKKNFFGVKQPAAPSDFLRTLYVERAFCASDEVRECTQISNGFDEITRVMIENKLNHIISKSEDSITKSIGKSDNSKFNFTNMHGLCITKNDEFNDVGNKRFKELYINFLVDSYIRLEDEGFGEIYFEGMSLKEYNPELAFEISDRIDKVRHSHTHRKNNLNNK